ncbi:MAG: RluA family pseudouridine synthase [Alphaproteobacteria bacterium]|nr:RluA family pseudouridine synthase [Alphaproteobacteria bacterium]
MTHVQNLIIAENEGECRLDRYLKRQFPKLKQGQIEKWLRLGQLRVDGKRVKAGLRLQPGQVIRIPPLIKELEATPAPQNPRDMPLTGKEQALIRNTVLYQDEDIIVINKPYGLAVQGGTKTFLHIDRLLEAFSEKDGQMPRLVHRIDKNTSGLLLLAKTLAASRFLTKAFYERKVHKTYWALVVGKPEKLSGQIKVPIAKLSGQNGEKMAVALENGLEATTVYRVLQHDHNSGLTLLELKPQTGRTHQLRVHCGILNTPILGDGKYGGAKAHPFHNRTKMHLHAYKIEFPSVNGEIKSFNAPLPEHMVETLKSIGFLNRIG